LLTEVAEAEAESTLSSGMRRAAAACGVSGGGCTSPAASAPAAGIDEDEAADRAGVKAEPKAERKAFRCERTSAVVVGMLAAAIGQTG
jgi:hypothetical protein